MKYIYILSVLFSICIKIYDELIDYYKLEHGNDIIEFIKIITIFILTLIITYSNNFYTYITLFFSLGMSIFLKKEYFGDVFFKFITIIFGIISLILIKIFFKQFNIKYFLVFIILSSIQFYPLFFQEKITIPFQDIIPLKKIQIILEKIQIKDEEIGYNKLKIRLLGVITIIIQLLLINGPICNYFNISYNSYHAIIINNLILLSYYLTSVIHQTYVLYQNIP